MLKRKTRKQNLKTTSTYNSIKIFKHLKKILRQDLTGNLETLPRKIKRDLNK